MVSELPIAMLACARIGAVHRCSVSLSAACCPVVLVLSHMQLQFCSVQEPHVKLNSIKGCCTAERSICRNDVNAQLAMCITCCESNAKQIVILLLNGVKLGCGQGTEA